MESKNQWHSTFNNGELAPTSEWRIPKSLNVLNFLERFPAFLRILLLKAKKENPQSVRNLMTKREKGIIRTGDCYASS